MIKVGLTGGIGSGKTTVSKIFEHLGVPVYNSDEKSKSIIQSNISLIEKIKNIFGEDLYDQDNILDRKKLSDIVFRDKSALEKLNSLVHPAVIQDFNKWCLTYEKQTYIIKESAILFESQSYKNLNKIITVFAPVEMRIQRIIKRDDVDKNKVIQIIKNQMPDDEKTSKSDFIIYADENHSLIEQVMAIHSQLLFQLFI